MTKYICECLDGARKCTHETSGFSAPTVCCVSAHATCHWRAAENQEGDTPAPKLPEWIKVGGWVWHGPFDGIVFEQPYFKIERIDGELVYEKSHNNGFPVHYTYLKPARLRPWTYKEAIGKTVFWKFDNSKKEIASMIDRADDEGNVYVFGYGELKAKKLMMEERFSQSDGSPCGVLEHKNEQGEWVK